MKPLVPDVLAPGLELVFCGSAPSRASAAAQAYYAKPGNLFWPTLHAIGLTPRLFQPGEYVQVLPLGIGLTDLCKHFSGNDDELPPEGWQPAALWRKIRTYQPRRLAFTSKTAARVALGHAADYGWQDDVGSTRIYVCCSTSGRARRFFDLAVWQELARDVAYKSSITPGDTHADAHR